MPRPSFRADQRAAGDVEFGSDVDPGLQIDIGLALPLDLQPDHPAAGFGVAIGRQVFEAHAAMRLHIPAMHVEQMRHAQPAAEAAKILLPPGRANHQQLLAPVVGIAPAAGRGGGELGVPPEILERQTKVVLVDVAAGAERRRVQPFLFVREAGADPPVLADSALSTRGELPAAFAETEIVGRGILREVVPSRDQPSALAVIEVPIGAALLGAAQQRIGETQFGVQGADLRIDRNLRMQRVDRLADRSPDRRSR